MRAILILLLSLVVGGFFVYKDYSTLTVTELNNNPGKYNERIVTVRGTVTQNASILNTGGFLLSDGESTILILSSNGVPQHREDIELTGLFRKTVSLNSFEYSVIYLDSGK